MSLRCLLRFFRPKDPFDNPEGRKDINKAYLAQKKEGWTFFNERLHMETVFSQRVNFILLLFPILVTTFVRVTGFPERLIISITGVGVLSVFYIPLVRTFFKLDTLQKITYKIEMSGAEENNPISFIQKQFEKQFAGQHKNRLFFKSGSYSIIMYGIAGMIFFMIVLVFYTIICGVK